MSTDKQSPPDLVYAPETLDRLKREIERLAQLQAPMISIGQLTAQDRKERRSPRVTVWFGSGGEA